MAKVRIIYNLKGGVGKTTLSVNLATCSAQRGFSTLLIDSDPQGNASSHILGLDAFPQKSIVDFYETSLGLQVFRQSLLEHVTNDTGIENLHLLASHRELEALRTKLEMKHKILKLRDALKFSTYERIYIDPPPANDFFSLSCLIAADEVLIPIDCDAFSMRAAVEIKNIIEEVKADYNPQLSVIGLILNQYQKGTRHAGEVVQLLNGGVYPLLEPYIPYSVRVKESHMEGMPVVMNTQHPVAQAIWELFDTIENESGQTLKANAKDLSLNQKNENTKI